MAIGTMYPGGIPGPGLIFEACVLVDVRRCPAGEENEDGSSRNIVDASVVLGSSEREGDDSAHTSSHCSSASKTHPFICGLFSN